MAEVRTVNARKLSDRVGYVRVAYFPGATGDRFALACERAPRRNWVRLTPRWAYAANGPDLRLIRAALQRELYANARFETIVSFCNEAVGSEMMPPGDYQVVLSLDVENERHFDRYYNSISAYRIWLSWAVILGNVARPPARGVGCVLGQPPNYIEYFRACTS